MASNSKKKRLFSGMGYREVQRSNSQRKKHLSKADQTWLKENNYKNTGWDNVIRLYQKINDFLDQSQDDDLSLEDLFLAADRIGNKYQTPEEIQSFQQALSATVESIAKQVDQQFPDDEIEVVDYRPSVSRPAQVSRSAKAKSKSTRKA